MAEALGRDVRVALPAICMDQTAGLHDVDDEALEALGVDVEHPPQSDTADLAGIHLDGDDDDRPVDHPAANDSRLLPTQVALIDLDVTGELIPIGPHHRPPELVEPRPGRLVAPEAQGPLQTKRARPVLLARDLPGGKEPAAKLTRALEDRARRRG